MVATYTIGSEDVFFNRLQEGNIMSETQKKFVSCEEDTKSFEHHIRNIQISEDDQQQSPTSRHEREEDAKESPTTKQ